MARTRGRPSTSKAGETRGEWDWGRQVGCGSVTLAAITDIWKRHIVVATPPLCVWDLS